MGNSVYDCNTSSHPGRVLCEDMNGGAKSKRTGMKSLAKDLFSTWSGDDASVYATKIAIFDQMAKIEESFIWVGLRMEQCTAAVEALSRDCASYVK